MPRPAITCARRSSPSWSTSAHPRPTDQPRLAMDALHGLSLADVLREHRRSWPARTAVVDGDIRLTYRELDDRVTRLAHVLATVGVGPGDRTLWLGQNSFRVLELLLAAAKLGAWCCPANWRQSVDELAFAIED